MHEPSVPDAAVSGSADTLIARGNTLLREGHVAAAIEQYFAALALQPESFEGRANLGSALLLAGRFAEARSHLSHARQMRPDQAPVHLALGHACSAQGQLEEAESSYRRALAISPDNAEALLALAGILRRRGQFQPAEACYRRVLERQPRHASAHYGLGHCLREAGRPSAAADSFERALDARPDYVDAHYRLAVLRPGDDANGVRRRQLESLRPRVPAMPLPQQVRFWFALGRRREDAGAYDAAFAAYAEGNRLQRERMGKLGDPESEALEARFIERIRNIFSREWLRDTAHGCLPDDGRVPVFIVGMPRSGTSLIEQMLASHPAVHGGGEMRHLPDLLEQTFGFAESEQGGRYPEVVPTLPADVLVRLGQSYLDRAWREAAHATHVTDKLTGNFLHAGMIHLLLPAARIIHVIRDPRDTCMSCFANLFRLGDIPYSYDLGMLGRHFVRHRELMSHWRAVLPANRFMVVRYEELVGDTETALRRVTDFVGLTWSDRCLDFHRQRRVVHTVSAGQVQRPIYATSVARWRHFERHLEPLFDALGEYGEDRGSSSGMS